MVWVSLDKDEAAAIAELNSISDRAAAIVAVTMLEDRIYRLLQDFFVDDTDIFKQMFRHSGALGSFSAKIDIAYLTGLISKKVYGEIHRLRGIRNDFAHETWAQGFEVSSIRDRCFALKLIETHVFEQGTPEHELPSGERHLMYEQNLVDHMADPRRRFLLSIRFFMSVLSFHLMLNVPTRHQKLPLL